MYSMGKTELFLGVPGSILRLDDDTYLIEVTGSVFISEKYHTAE